MYTHGGELNCLYVLHASMPQFASSQRQERDTLERTMQSCLEVANSELKLNSIAFPLLYNRFLGMQKPEVADLMFN